MAKKATKKKLTEQEKMVRVMQKEQAKREREVKDIQARVSAFQEDLKELAKKHNVKLLVSGIEKKGNHFLSEFGVNSILERRGLIALTEEALN